jgi:hypothetical protein
MTQYQKGHDQQPHQKPHQKHKHEKTPESSAGNMCLSADITDLDPLVLSYCLENHTDHDCYLLNGSPCILDPKDGYEFDHHRGFFIDAQDAHSESDAAAHAAAHAHVNDQHRHLYVAQHYFTPPAWITHLQYPLCPAAVRVKKNGGIYRGMIMNTQPLRLQTPYDMLHKQRQKMVNAAEMIHHLTLRLGYISAEDVPESLMMDMIMMDRSKSGIWQSNDTEFYIKDEEAAVSVTDPASKTEDANPAPIMDPDHIRQGNETALYRFSADILSQYQKYIEITVKDAALMVML